MNKITHHPADDVLLRYVAGRYDTAYNLVLATHLSNCAHCRKTVAMQQEIGGQALNVQSPITMNVSAADLLDRQPEPVQSMPVSKRGSSKKFDLDIPAILNTYLPGGFDKIKWQRLSPSLKQHIFKVDGSSTARFLWMAPGKAVPSHGHNGEEMTLVMSGGYFDGDVAYTQGDLQWVEHSTPHMPTAMDNAPCLVLAATDSALKFNNILPRLLQPFFKI